MPYVLIGKCSDISDMGGHTVDLAPFLVRLGAGVGAAAIIWIVAADYGTLFVSRWIRFSHPAARLGIAAAAGYLALGSCVGLLALFHLAHPVGLSVLLGIAIIIRLPALSRRLALIPAVAAQMQRALARADLPARLSIAIIGAALLTGLVNSALPAVWWDPIAYHLPILRAALAQGTFSFDPQMAQSGFVVLAEAATLPAYVIAGSAGAAMTTLGAGLCVGLLVWALADLVRAGSGVTAAMLAVSSPLWGWLAPSFYVDVVLAMFVLAAIVTLLERPFEGAMMSGALCGGAAAVKYAGLGAALAICIFAIATAGKRRLRSVVPFCAGFFALAAGWYARSWMLTGDPVYPFLSATLGRSPAVRDFAVRYVDMTRHWCGGGTSAGDLLALPWRLLAQPRMFCGDPGTALQLGAVFALAGLLLVARTRMVAALAGALTFLWFVTSQQWRFLLAPAFVYAAVVAAGAEAAGDRLRWASRLILAACCAAVVAFDWIGATRDQASASIVPAFDYMRGAQSAADYLGTRLETFAAARWLAENHAQGSQVLALDDVRDYYFPTGTAWANPYYQQDITLDWNLPSAQRYAPLLRRGIKYVVVNQNQAYLHRTPTGIDWNAFAADTRSVLHERFAAEDVSIYELSATQ